MPPGLHLLQSLAMLLAAMAIAVAGAQASQSDSTIPTAAIFEAIEAGEGMTVCEIGAGDGELSVEAARLVGPQGRVYTSELGEERLTALQGTVGSSGLAHITVVEGGPDRTNLPDGACDALFMRNVYHHFGDPRAMNRSIVAALAPGARVAIVDFRPRGTEASRPGDRDENGSHGVSAEAVSREMQEAGLRPIDSQAGEGRWYIVVFTTP